MPLSLMTTRLSGFPLAPHVVRRERKRLLDLHERGDVLRFELAILRRANAELVLAPDVHCGLCRKFEADRQDADLLAFLFEVPCRFGEDVLVPGTQELHTSRVGSLE